MSYEPTESRAKKEDGNIQLPALFLVRSTHKLKVAYELCYWENNEEYLLINSGMNV